MDTPARRSSADYLAFLSLVKAFCKASAVLRFGGADGVPQALISAAGTLAAAARDAGVSPDDAVLALRSEWANCIETKVLSDTSRRRDYYTALGLLLDTFFASVH